MSGILHALVADFSAEALALAAQYPPGSSERASITEVVSVPEKNEADLEAISEWIAERSP